MQSLRYQDFELTALGHDGFLITKDGLRLAIDPYQVALKEQVDLVFVTHQHFDHCDVSTIRKILKPEGKIIAPEPCQEELAELGPRRQFNTEGEEVGPVSYKTIPAYNLNKYRAPNLVFHPRDLGGVGYIITWDKTTFYHAGDTDFVSEMSELKKIDVAFLPVSGTYVMTAEEAAEAAKAIAPKLTIPMHYGKVLGSIADAKRFCQQIEPLPSQILIAAAVL